MKIKNWPSAHMWACQVCLCTATFHRAGSEAPGTGFEGWILFYEQAQQFFRPFPITTWCKLNLMLCPGEKTLLFTSQHGVPLQPVLLSCFIQIYCIHFSVSFMVIFSCKHINVNCDCLCRDKWRCMFLHGKRIKILVILLDLLHQINIKYDLNFSFLAIAAGWRGKEQTKEIQTFQLCFATIISLSP